MGINNSKTTKFLLLFFSASLSLFAEDSVNIDAPAMPEPPPHTKQRFINWLHYRHSPKFVGNDDPNLPEAFWYKPDMILLPPRYELPSSFVVNDDRLDLLSLTPAVLKDLSKENLRKLLIYLASIPAEVMYIDQKGKIISGQKRKVRSHYFKRWELSNTASALIFTVALEQEMELFIHMVSVTPEAILPSLHGSLRGLIDQEILSAILVQMLIDVDESLEGSAEPAARKMSKLIQYELSYWVAKDARRLALYLGDLLDKTMLLLGEQKIVCKEKAVGVLIGSIISAALMHVQSIKQKDEKRIWLVGVVSNLIWAATSFLAVVPLSAPVIAAVGGGISFGAVMTSAVYTVLNYPRDYSSNVREIEGKIEMAILESRSILGQVLSAEEVSYLLFFMRASIHAGGQHD
jgi:hypothetical protein